MELWRTGTIVDLSAGGFRLTTTQALDEGVKLEFEIRLPGRAGPYVLYGQIVWTKDIAVDLKEYGVELVDITPDNKAELDELVQFLLKARLKP
jgi:hypothetical protein